MFLRLVCRVLCWSAVRTYLLGMLLLAIGCSKNEPAQSKGAADTASAPTAAANAPASPTAAAVPEPQASAAPTAPIAAGEGTDVDAKESATPPPRAASKAKRAAHNKPV